MLFIQLIAVPPVWFGPKGVGANQPVHWFLGGKGLGIQQGTNVVLLLVLTTSLDVVKDLS